MKRIILESPYAGTDIKQNIEYAKACIRDCLLHGESAIASHLLYTQEGILDDDKAFERAIGIAAGLAWSDLADYVVVYTDLGITKGMKIGIEQHQKNKTKVIYRTLPNWNYEDDKKVSKISK